MKRARTPRSRAITLGAALCLSIAPACQDLNAFVTGETFYSPADGSPRMEVELEVHLEDDLAEVLEGIHHTEEWNGAIASQVLSVADLGMRFYPILSDSYSPGDARPAYRMIVRIQDMQVKLDQELVETEGFEPQVETWVDGFDCHVSATVERRRETGPPLVVGHSMGRGHVRVSRKQQHLTEETSYPVRRGAEDAEPLRIPQEDVLEAVEEAAVDALRDLVRPVDRDFALSRQ